ncbi:MAG: hypothetical protein PF503_25095 [Desulfobacula sp.]|jgi:hypothetical protein|nr:hypothetical protein [Desulfobacula sp.]
MNWMLLVAGITSALTTIGHFLVGTKMFLVPMLESDFELVPKKGMHCVFHYVSVYLILSAAFLLLAGFGVDMGSDNTLLIRFIAVNYTGFAIWQIVIAAKSGISNVITKLFQWVFFVIIAVCSFWGTI